MNLSQRLLPGWALLACVSCIPVSTPPGEGTVVLLLDDQGWAAEDGASQYRVLDSRAASTAFWLSYAEPASELPWPASTVRGDKTGATIPLPERMTHVLTGDEISTLELAQRRFSSPPRPCQFRETTARREKLLGTQWSDDSILLPGSFGLLEIHTAGGLVASATLAAAIHQVEAVGSERAVGLGERSQEVVIIDSTTFQGAAPQPVRFDAPFPRVPMDQVLVRNTGVHRDFAYFFVNFSSGATGDSSLYKITASGQVSLLSEKSTAIDAFGAGERALMLRGLEATFIDPPRDTLRISTVDLPYLSLLITARKLPTRRGEALFAVAQGTVGQVLLRFDGSTWRPQTVLDVEPNTAIALGAQRDILVFGHAGGWGTFDVMNGVRCDGPSQLNHVRNVIALPNGTFYLQGQDERGATASVWLLPK